MTKRCGPGVPLGLASQATFKVIANGSTLGNQSLVTQRTPAGGYRLWEVISSGIGNPNGHGSAKVIKNPQKRTSSSGAGITITETTVRRSELRN